MIFTVEIANWEKYNPRSDVKSSSWFRMDNNFFTDPDFYGHSLVTKATWLCILASASSKMSSIIKINTKQLADILGSNSDDIGRGIQDISEIRSTTGGAILVIHSPVISPRSNPIESDRVTQSNCTLRTDERNERTDERTISSELGKAASSPIVTKLKAIGPIQEFTNELHKHLLSTVPQDTQKLWLQTYQNLPWIEAEFTKMVNWIKVNPRKAPKSRLDRFVSSWLSRSWDEYRKTLPGQSSSQSHRTQSTVTVEDLERAKQLGIL